jgi:hypothetical protein
VSILTIRVRAPADYSATKGALELVAATECCKLHFYIGVYGAKQPAVLTNCCRVVFGGSSVPNEWSKAQLLWTAFTTSIHQFTPGSPLAMSLSCYSPQALPTLRQHRLVPYPACPAGVPTLYSPTQLARKGPPGNCEIVSAKFWLWRCCRLWKCSNLKLVKLAAELRIQTPGPPFPALSKAPTRPSCLVACLSNTCYWKPLRLQWSYICLTLPCVRTSGHEWSC